MTNTLSNGKSRGKPQSFTFSGDAPAAAELDRADAGREHLGVDDLAVALLDQQARHVAPAEIEREREADRAAADDEHGDVGRPPSGDPARRYSSVSGFPPEILGALHLDQHAKALLVRIAVLLGLDQALPDLVVDRPGLVDARRAVEARDAAGRQQSELAQLDLAQEHRDLGAVGQVRVGRAVPRSHSARCSSS